MSPNVTLHVSRICLSVVFTYEFRNEDIVGTFLLERIGICLEKNKDKVKL